MRDEQALQQRGVEPVERADGVDDRVLRRQLEHHGDVAELQVGVDEHDRACRLRWARTTARLVAIDRLAGAALGGEHGDDPAELAVGVVGRRRRRRRRAGADEPRLGRPGRTASASCAGLDRGLRARP